MRQSWTIIMKSGRNLLGWCPGRQAMAGNKLLKQIELAAGLVKNFALIFIGALMILVLLGAYQAQQLIQSMNH